MDQWPPGRLQDRFDAVDEHLADLKETLKIFYPLPGQVGLLEHKIEALEEDMTELRSDVRELTKEQTTLVRADRSERLRQAGLLLGPSIALAGMVIIAVITGRIG